MATKTKNDPSPLQHILNPRQEIETLQRSWSLVGHEGAWKVLPTTTVTAGASGEALDILPYLGRTGAEVFSIVEHDDIGVCYQQFDFTRVPTLFGAKLSMDVFEVNRQGMISYTQKLRRILGSKILTLDSNQTIKIVPKDAKPQDPVGETALLVALALRSPGEYQDAFTVDNVRKTVGLYTEQFAAAKVRETVTFPLAEYTHVPFPASFSRSAA
jgi:hypothetical protein